MLASCESDMMVANADGEREAVDPGVIGRIRGTVLEAVRGGMVMVVSGLL